MCTEEQKRRQSQVMRDKGLTEQLKQALKIANAMPESQRGPQNRNSKVWTLIDPDGNEVIVINLLDWARKNAHLFDAVHSAEEREHVATNIKSGFVQISRCMQGKRKRPAYSYKGWGLAKPPE